MTQKIRAISMPLLIYEYPLRGTPFIPVIGQFIHVEVETLPTLFTPEMGEAQSLHINGQKQETTSS